MKAGRFESGERVQVRLKCGPVQIVRDGHIKRAFGSEAYNVILDKPLKGCRQTYCEPEEVFPAAQNDLFPRS
jgi:hypothetical protein